MLRLLKNIFEAGCRTQKISFPDLPSYVNGLPSINLEKNCSVDECSLCVDICPTSAIEIQTDQNGKNSPKLDLGACLACGLCVETCPSEIFQKSTRTRTASQQRNDLILGSLVENVLPPVSQNVTGIFKRAIAVRVVSTGCSACDLEVNAAFNPIFDASRFGISYVASPRMADAILVTGPCPRGMHEALKRTYEAMPDPKVVIACGTCAISGGIHKGGYAEANGLDSILPVDIYIPGCPPHPWSIIDGIQQAMKLR